MLKVFNPTSDERGSAEVLRYFGGVGAVTVREADDGGLLLERLDDQPHLATLALNGGDDEAAELLASVVKLLHAPPNRRHPSGLVPLRQWFRALFDREADLPILRRCAAAARRLLANAGEDIVLHGDLHHWNVLASGRGWLAIDPKGLLGERAYELANLLGNPFPFGEIVHDADRMGRLATLYADRLGLDRQRVLGFALVHAGLAAAWSMEDGTDPSFRLTCAEILDQMSA